MSSRKSLQNNHPLSRRQQTSSSWFLSSNAAMRIVCVSIVSITLVLLGGMIYMRSLLGGDNKNKAVSGLDSRRAKREFLDQSKQELDSIRKEFRNRYGPLSDQILQRGVQTFGSFDHLAHRFLKASFRSHDTIGPRRSQKDSFEMAFAGYSVTVGRGNFFQESYPFVLQKILEPALVKIFNLKLSVRNAAIGGIPSFPYGFCLSHFLGSSPDVVSWDYAMNEMGQDNTAVLESYIRHSLHQLGDSTGETLAQPPVLLISLDTHKGRCDLLNQYAQRGLLLNAMCVSRADSIFNKADFQQLQPLPPGFQDWDQFGAPPNCPGRSSWHPKKKEHELIAWIIAMQFIKALERALQIMQTDDLWMTKYGQEDRNKLSLVQQRHPIFPEPLSKSLPQNPDPAIHKLLYGHEVTSVQPKSYEMHHVSCRTNFLPATDSQKVLPNIVVSGWNSAATAETIMDERSNDQYRAGWVLDVSDVERQTKIKVKKCGGLGYEDMKIALYGIPESGTLRLWLPIEAHIAKQHHANHNHDQEINNKDKSNGALSALHWLDSLIICEANEKRSENACHLDRDLVLSVGGAVENPKIQVIHGVGEYLKRPTCVHVTIPETALMTPLSQLTTLDQSPISAETRQRLVQGWNEDVTNDPLGLVVDVQAAARITRASGACCLSHVAWELH